MKDLFKMVGVLTAICLVAGLALSQVYALTKVPIEKAERLEMLSALKAVMPGYDNEPDKDTKEIGSRKFFLGKKGDNIVGYAYKASSPNGYSGNIEIMVGLLPDGSVNGLMILKHAETPGLGQKIENMKWRSKAIWIWKDKEKTDIHRNLANTKWKVKKDGGDIDQISGATISPRAVVEAIFAGLEDFDKAKGDLGGSTGQTDLSTKINLPVAPANEIESAGVKPNPLAADKADEKTEVDTKEKVK